MMSTSIGTIFLIVILSVLFIAVLLLQKTDPSFLKNKGIKSHLFWIEITLGVLILALLTGYFYRHHSVMFALAFLVLTLVTIFLGLFFLKDYLAGLIVKMSKNYALNDRLKFEEQEGKITAFAIRHLEIVNSNNDKVLIPYSKLITGVKQITGIKDKLTTYTFTLSGKKEENTAGYIQKMSDYIRTLPWSHHTIPPEIIITDTDEKGTVVKITVFALDGRYFERIEEAVRREFG